MIQPALINHAAFSFLLFAGLTSMCFLWSTGNGARAVPKMEGPARRPWWKPAPLHRTASGLPCCSKTRRPGADEMSAQPLGGSLTHCLSFAWRCLPSIQCFSTAIDTNNILAFGLVEVIVPGIQVLSPVVERLQRIQ